MNEDWRNAFGILMCTEVCDSTSMGICDGAPSTCSSFDWAVKLQTSQPISLQAQSWRTKPAQEKCG